MNTDAAPDNGARREVEALPHRHPTLAGFCLPDEHAANSMFGGPLVDLAAVLRILDRSAPPPEVERLREALRRWLGSTDDDHAADAELIDAAKEWLGDAA